MRKPFKGKSFSFYTFSIMTCIWPFQAELYNEPVHEISNNVVFATSKASDQPGHTRSLIRAFACRLTII